MDRRAALAQVLALIAGQRGREAGEFVAHLTHLTPCYRASLAAFVAVMTCEHEHARVSALEATTRPPTDEFESLLAQTVLALAATSDLGLAECEPQQMDDLAVSLSRIEPPEAEMAAFARYLLVEAALAGGRLQNARELSLTGAPAYELWASSRFCAVMVACEARIAAFTGNVDRAIHLLDQALAGDPSSGVLLATRALAAGAAGDLPGMQALAREVAELRLPPIDRIGRGVELLLAFSADAVADSRAAVEHLLRAGGGADLAGLFIVDRAWGYELLISAAIEDEDLESAVGWLHEARHLQSHRIAAPSVARCEARVALAVGDPNAAIGFAQGAINLAERDERVIERNQAEMLLARAHIAAGRIPEAARGLRAAVSAGDRSGYHAVRRNATAVLRPVRRRLPPVAGAGRRHLSARECEVADLIAQGADNAQIAEALFLSMTTVRAHVTRILTAYGVGTRTALLAQLHEPADPMVAVPELTARQVEVAHLVALGYRNQEIADALRVSVKSVETHIAAIRDRWQAGSRFEVARRWWDAQSAAVPRA